MDKGGRSYRFNLRVAPDWIDRVRAAAEARGISMADFVIMVVNERLNPEAAMPPPPPERGRPKKDAGRVETPENVKPKRGRRK